MREGRHGPDATKKAQNMNLLCISEQKLALSPMHSQGCTLMGQEKKETYEGDVEVKVSYLNLH